MTNLKLKIASAAATAGLLATSFAPAAFADTVVVKGNGADSTNKVKVNKKTKTKVSQTNNTAVVNLVGVMQNTGGNTANKNTGGDVTVGSGDATATVTNTTKTGNNSATVTGCPCEDSDDTIRISGNGADSTNKVKSNTKTKTVVSQTNNTLVVNGVLVAQNTGDNHANKNTGGDVDVDSGEADATVENTTTTGANTVTLE